MMTIIRKNSSSTLEWFWKKMPSSGFVFFEMSPLSKFKLIKNNEIVLELFIDTTQKNHLTFNSPDDGNIYIVAIFNDINNIPEGDYSYHLYVSYASSENEPVFDYSGKIKVVDD
jgi:hypothetical protein